MAGPKLLACSIALMAGCIEDQTLGIEAGSVELPRGVVHPLNLSATQALPALSSFVLDVDDPSVAGVALSADQRRIEVRALGEGHTTIHLTYRESAIHVPTTIVAARTVTLAIHPGGVTTPIGTTVSLAATATNTADEQIDVTARAIWTVADPRVAQLFSDGSLHGMAAGTTTIRAELDGVAHIADVAVVPAL
jgi:hypothetical protein